MEFPEGNVREAQSWRMVLNFDLNHLPPEENNVTDSVSTSNSPQEVQAEEHGQSQHQPMMDVEVIDNEVAIISQRIYVEARNKSNRNRGATNVRDEVTRFNNGHSEFSSWLPFSVNKCKRSPGNLELNLNLEVNKKAKIKSFPLTPEWSLSMPPSEAPTFSCPVCMGKLIEETSTKCGHIFCKKCIQGAIAAQKKCPTCRQKVTKRDIIRIYLPSTN
ncbi:hypothetical protein L1049_016984 [Liquidambar formosana]|uniref:RING-type domain-containing protein n=1 Tax=Liquidambar formosana TaxID=63359 RepID=A0AAP0S0C3_LIQFO